ncbi:MAG: hypothetical protein GF329_04835 [Candidatus Lokiarchaeota archaeon]|nr:hypothetical protein [Candidatus Lokiarchaeota archaeon]
MGNIDKKFIVLGGAGDMGSNVVKYLHGLLGGESDNITIGDYRVKIAEKKALAIDEDIKVIKVDANKDRELIKILEEHDILINCIGPNFKYAIKIVEAAARAGINGVDICDDVEPTLKMLELNKTDSIFRDITYIYGCGWTPGLTNILSRRASELLDSLESLLIAWTGDPSSEGIAVIEHMLKIMTGKVASYKDGKIIYIPAGEGIERLKFPRPIGIAKVFDVGHPEPITLPKFITGLKNVSVKGGIVPFWATNFFKKNYVDKNRTNTPEKIHESALELKKLSQTDLKNAIVEIPSTFKVKATGILEGKIKNIDFSGAGRMEQLTSLPAALAAVMIVEGKINSKGVLPPEASIPTEYFLQEFQKHGVKINIE